MTNDILALVVLMLATVTFDGFSATSAWVDFQTFVVDRFGVGEDEIFNSLTLADTFGVALCRWDSFWSIYSSPSSWRTQSPAT